MHVLIVTARPGEASLTQALGRAVADGVEAAGATAEIADLASEGFDPRFTARDIEVHLATAVPDADVTAEQRRLDRADALVLVYPIYWWSFPGLLKGWVDRVFCRGWAYEVNEADAVIEKRLTNLTVHLVAVGGAGLRTYARHGYFGAMKLQIDHGVFDYCGATVATSELMADPVPEAALEHARAIGRRAALVRGALHRAA
ncbi:MAG TPA: NAD(P)H-dependent oxidoreductase [Brevundimonas sp.]|jgi:NAD(P)H dehydrogenase (quinone)